MKDRNSVLPPVVELEAVRKRFGATDAVAGVSLAVRPGEFFSILGPSGCGKTTTLRLIAGFEDPTSGRVLLEGRDVTGVPPSRRNVNTVFQHYALFPHMSVLDNVAFGPRSRGMPPGPARRLAAEALAFVHLEGFERRRPRELSGGEQQRVALARALVNRPAALLLDEPLGALDLKLREAMQLELKRLQRDAGIAFVHVTHDQQEALRMSDRIAVMHAGRVEQVGAPEEVYRRPATVFVAGFVGVASLVPAVVRARSGDRLMLDASGSIVHGVGAPDLREGDEVFVVVRPEDARLTGTADGALPGMVADRLFEGDSVRAVVRTAGGDVHVRLAAPPPDGQVFVAWDPSRAYVLPRDPKQEGTQ